MGFWEILFLVLLIISLGLVGFAIYRWWQFKKKLSFTEKLIGKRIEDLVNLPHLKGAQVPLNLPKRGR